MRAALILALTAAPAAAWEFSATPICTLTGPGVAITYDARLPEYTITVTRPDAAWDDAPVFGMTFDGARPINIQTDRHERTTDGRSITVADVGFDNVLNGLQLGTTATAYSGTTFTDIPLAGIGPAIRAFRDCPNDALS